ncbi:MAG: zinc ribbon domain-containing protein, partial [Verrucomicrobiota bacterium]|nr:zinc ribbon domain-containing protein [Verrucomicrobiota bacterium]
AGIIFKGSGFYETDYRSESYKAGAKKDSDSKKSTSKKDSKSKSDNKSKSTKPKKKN